MQLSLDVMLFTFTADLLTLSKSDNTSSLRHTVSVLCPEAGNWNNTRGFWETFQFSVINQWSVTSSAAVTSPRWPPCSSLDQDAALWEHKHWWERPRAATSQDRRESTDPVWTGSESHTWCLSVCWSLVLKLSERQNQHEANWVREGSEQDEPPNKSAHTDNWGSGSGSVLWAADIQEQLYDDHWRLCFISLMTNWQTSCVRFWPSSDWISTLSSLFTTDKGLINEVHEGNTKGRGFSSLLNSADIKVSHFILTKPFYVDHIQRAQTNITLMIHSVTQISASRSVRRQHIQTCGKVQAVQSTDNTSVMISSHRLLWKSLTVSDFRFWINQESINCESSNVQINKEDLCQFSLQNNSNSTNWAGSLNVLI